MRTPEGMIENTLVQAPHRAKKRDALLRREIRGLLARVRWLSIGGINNTAEVRLTREQYDRIKRLLGDD